MFIICLILGFLLGYCIGEVLWVLAGHPREPWIPLYRLRGKRLIWTSRLKVFMGGGYPKYQIIPRLHRMRFSAYWKLRGIRIYWLGHELHLVVGKDIHGLYQ